MFQLRHPVKLLCATTSPAVVADLKHPGRIQNKVKFFRLMSYYVA
jgi:hypothetical protein